MKTGSWEKSFENGRIDSVSKVFYAAFQNGHFTEVLPLLAAEPPMRAARDGLHTFLSIPVIAQKSPAEIRSEQQKASHSLHDKENTLCKHGKNTFLRLAKTWKISFFLRLHLDKKHNLTYNIVAIRLQFMCNNTGG